MKFKFIGKPNILYDTLTTNKIYNILQFEKVGKYILVYFIDDTNNLLYIPYANISKFNQDWRYMEND